MTFKRFKSAITYKCDLPLSSQLQQHLEQHQFSELTTHEYMRSGFVQVPGTDYLVFRFPSGLAFTLRIDEKIVPASIVAQEANKRINEIEADQDKRLPKKQRNEIKEQAYMEMVAVALVSSKLITCYYHIKDRLLVVPTSSQKVSDLVTARLIKAIGTIRAESICVDSFSQGLTPKVEQFMNGAYTFDKFNVCGSIKLKNEESKNAFSFNVSEIELAQDGVLEAISVGAKVTEIELSNDDMHFKITNKFNIKGIGYIDDGQEPPEYSDSMEELTHESSVQLELFSAAMNDLIELFEYKEPTKPEVKSEQ